MASKLFKTTFMGCEIRSTIPTSVMELLLHHASGETEIFQWWEQEVKSQQKTYGKKENQK